MLPPVILAVTDTVVPVCVVAFTLAPPNTLPPVTLPDADTCPAVRRLPPSTLPVADTSPTVRMLPACMFPATLSAVPLVLAMVTTVAVLNVTLPAAVFAVIGPICMLVVDPDKPPVPIVTVLVLPDAVAPSPMSTV